MFLEKLPVMLCSSIRASRCLVWILTPLGRSPDKMSNIPETRGDKTSRCDLTLKGNIYRWIESSEIQKQG